MVRALHVRPGIGMAAHVLQSRGLEFLRVHVDHPALILVGRGIKTVRPARGPALRAQPGQAIVIEGNQTVDFTNAVPEGSHYEARWLLFDSALLDDAFFSVRAALQGSSDSGHGQARLLTQVHDGLFAAFNHAWLPMSPSSGVPDAAMRQRLLEVMHWLLEEAIVLRTSPVIPSISVKVRALIAGRLERSWTADRVASELALSEATLRRRLTSEGTTLRELLVEARMATALTLLQATSQSVSSIAVAVGYESASRFAVRFRQRFGFAPTAVRGHGRGG